MVKKRIKNKEYEKLEYKDNIELINEDSEATIKEMIN